MFVILLETGSESGLFRACRHDTRRQFLLCACPCCWAPARFSLVLLAPPLHGFAHLGSNSNYKEWQFFGDRRGPWTGIGFSIETLVLFDTKQAWRGFRERSYGSREK